MAKMAIVIYMQECNILESGHTADSNIGIGSGWLMSRTWEDSSCKAASAPNATSSTARQSTLQLILLILTWRHRNSGLNS